MSQPKYGAIDTDVEKAALLKEPTTTTDDTQKHTCLPFHGQHHETEAFLGYYPALVMAYFDDPDPSRPW